MDFRDTPEEEHFRTELRKWIAQNAPREPIPTDADAQAAFLNGWHRELYRAGYIGLSFPEDCGGHGKPEIYDAILNDELGAAEAPPGPAIAHIANAIRIFGSDEQRRRHLPGLLSGEVRWCQGFSEPGAGSDLASVQTFAERKGDKWVINGHKVWTSLAHFAEWMILLLRTDKSHKYDGLSYFVVPIRSALGKGVTVRPLIKMTGETGFNEVLFDDLEIDDGMRLDDVGKGWQVAMTTLAHERGAGPLVTPQSGGRRSQAEEGGIAGALIGLAKESYRDGQRAADDPLIRDRIMQMVIREEGFRLNAKRARVAGLTDHPMRIPLQHKLVISEIAQDVAQVAMDIEGAAASLYIADTNAPHKGRWPLAYMNSYGFTIAAGTSEVQRNILGERVLGLAKTK